LPRCVKIKLRLLYWFMYALIDIYLSVILLVTPLHGLNISIRFCFKLITWRWGHDLLIKPVFWVFFGDPSRVLLPSSRNFLCSSPIWRYFGFPVAASQLLPAEKACGAGVRMFFFSTFTFRLLLLCGCFSTSFCFLWLVHFHLS